MPLTGPEVLIYERNGPVVTITLNRPERLNAISIELRRQLSEAFPRIAAEHAEFAITEAKWSRGSAYAVPLLWMLPLGVGLEVLFTGERFTARRLYELGFVNRVVPAAELMPAARALAAQIAENAPLT